MTDERVAVLERDPIRRDPFALLSYLVPHRVT
jgi:hypothetical protein